MRYAMIMAGGRGTRLWPMSRRSLPKQLLPIIDGVSLLELAFNRTESVIEPGNRLICTAESFREQIKLALPGISDDNILGEPVGRDTVNAIGLTAAVLLNRDPDAVFAVLTADHVIQPVDRFAGRLAGALRLVEEDACDFATFSINPTFPATQFGWIERGKAIPGYDDVFECVRFVEKPDNERAEAYLYSGVFGWNSGMFVFRASSFMQALQWHLPETHTGLMKIAEAWNTPNQSRVLEEVYPTLQRISVDFAIMQPASSDDRIRLGLVTLDIDWTDVGSWPAYGGTLEPDADGNRSNGPVVYIGSSNVLAVTDDPAHTITTIGCEDLIVIHTRDATLVCPASKAERVKEMADLVDEELQ